MTSQAARSGFGGPSTNFGGIVLTGGGAARLGGADKATIEVGGRSLLEHALAALEGAAEVVVVGPEVPTSRPVTFVQEDPAGGGPAAGLVTALSAFARHPDLVVVLAVDMPLVSAGTVGRLLAAAREEDGAVLVDAAGRAQPLCAAYAVAALERVRNDVADGSAHGLAMRVLLAPLRLARVDEVDDEAHDLDTWEDLAELREVFEDRAGRGDPGRA